MLSFKREIQIQYKIQISLKIEFITKLKLLIQNIQRSAYQFFYLKDVFEGKKLTRTILLVNESAILECGSQED